MRFDGSDTEYLERVYRVRMVDPAYVFVCEPHGYRGWGVLVSTDQVRGFYQVKPLKPVSTLSLRGPGVLDVDPEHAWSPEDLVSFAVVVYRDAGPIRVERLERSDKDPERPYVIWLADGGPLQSWDPRYVEKIVDV